MTDDNDKAGGRREKRLTALKRQSNHGNLAVKVKPFPSEAYKIASRSKIAMSMSSKGATYKIVFHRYVIHKLRHLDKG